jgi:hypothetical protein
MLRGTKMDLSCENQLSIMVMFPFIVKRRLQEFSVDSDESGIVMSKWEKTERATTIPINRKCPRIQNDDRWGYCL